MNLVSLEYLRPKCSITRHIVSFDDDIFNQITKISFHFQTIKAQRAVTEMRGRYFKGSKLQIDYASHEFRAAFFEQCRNSGMDMKERSKPWETQQPPPVPASSAVIAASTTSADNSNSPEKGWVLTVHPSPICGVR